MAWFSLEFLLRFIQAKSKFAFLRRPLTLIDIIAILPYYITLLVDTTSVGYKKPSSGSIYLDKVGLVLRILRALRILYVMRLARHSLGLQTLGADRSQVHPGVRALAALPLRGHRTVRTAPVCHRERDGGLTGVYQHPRVLLVGCHHHDHGRLRRYGSQKHSRPSGGTQQHTEWHPPHGIPGHLHLPHVFTLLH